MGLAKSLLLQGKGEEGIALLDEIPASKEYDSAEKLKPLANALRTHNIDSPPNIDNPNEAAYHNSLNLIERGNLEAAMDGLLGIIREDRRFRDGEPQKLLIAIFELLGDKNPVTSQYRSELASALF